MYWENNHATFGGAVSIIDASPFVYCTLVPTNVLEGNCFFQLPDLNLSAHASDVQLVFKNNSVHTAGGMSYMVVQEVHYMVVQ